MGGLKYVVCQHVQIHMYLCVVFSCHAVLSYDPPRNPPHMGDVPPP